MGISNLAEKDFEEVVQFLNETMPYDEFSVESLKEQTIGDPDYESDLVLIARDKRINGFILGICRENFGGIKLFSVRDTKNSEDIGICLLEKLEKKFIDRGISKVTVGHVFPKYFWPGIDACYTAAVAILLKNGYKIEGTGKNMEVDLTVGKFDTDKEEERLRKAGIIVKRLADQDRQIYMHFLKDWEGSWFYLGMLAYSNKPISCHIAIQNNIVIGFACHSVSADHYFGPMAASPRERGKGIGQVLLKRCLKDIKRIGEKKATILAVGPIYFYWKTVKAKISRLFLEMSKDFK